MRWKSADELMHVMTRRMAIAMLSLAAPVTPLVIPAAASAQSNNPTPISHVIIIMQENHSFDNYFGTYPGANGISSNICVPYVPKHPEQGCLAPFYDPHDITAGAGHQALDAQRDIDAGPNGPLMDGFVHEQTIGRATCATTTSPETLGVCALAQDGMRRHDTMGYHTGAEIPNYWTYAQNFVLQDQLFTGERGWSFANHLDLVSEWSAQCTDPANPMSCVSTPAPKPPPRTAIYPWVNLLQLLDQNGVGWKYYLAQGIEPDCEDDAATCAPVIPQAPTVPSIWNPVPNFAWVKAQGPAYLKAHNPGIDQFLLDAKNNTLPQVAWVLPDEPRSEHPPTSITAGMEYVTSLVNAVMQSASWNSTVIFICWDEWGGFYDHVPPPNVDFDSGPTPVMGFGLRVPGLVISPWVKAGTIDHQFLGFDSYATFIEDLFLRSTRLDPTAMGQPDSRPTIRDKLIGTSITFPNGVSQPVGDLMNDFDFTQVPLPPLVLSTHIPTNLQVSCGTNVGEVCTQPNVTLSWSPVGTAAEAGNFTYYIQRDGNTVVDACTGTATTCVDTPGSGNHLYRAYTTDLNGATSPLSAAAEADVP